MPTAIHQKVRLANSDQYPNAIIRMKSGWVVLGEVQPLEGYCLIFSDPVASNLNALNEAQRIQYSLDTIHVGDALLKIKKAARINYETYGNLDQALHTHIIPRYLDEPEDKRTLPAMKAYDWKSARPFSPDTDGPFIAQMREYLLPFST